MGKPAVPTRQQLLERLEAQVAERDQLTPAGGSVRVSTAAAEEAATGELTAA